MMKTFTGLLKGMVPSVEPSGVGRPSVLSLQLGLGEEEEEERRLELEL